MLWYHLVHVPSSSSCVHRKTSCVARTSWLRSFWNMPPVLMQPVVALREWGCLSPVSSVGEKCPRACHVPVGLFLVSLYSHLPLFPLVLSVFAGEELPVPRNFWGWNPAGQRHILYWHLQNVPLDLKEGRTHLRGSPASGAEGRGAPWWLRRGTSCPVTKKGEEGLLGEPRKGGDKVEQVQRRIPRIVRGQGLWRWEERLRTQGSLSCEKKMLSRDQIGASLQCLQGGYCNGWRMSTVVRNWRGSLWLVTQTQMITLRVPKHGSRGAKRLWNVCPQGIVRPERKIGWCEPAWSRRVPSLTPWNAFQPEGLLPGERIAWANVWRMSRDAHWNAGRGMQNVSFAGESGQVEFPRGSPCLFLL